MSDNEKQLVDVWRLFKKFSSNRYHPYARLVLYDDASGNLLVDDAGEEDDVFPFTDLAGAIIILAKEIEEQMRLIIVCAEGK